MTTFDLQNKRTIHEITSPTIAELLHHAFTADPQERSMLMLSSSSDDDSGMVVHRFRVNMFEKPAPGKLILKGTVNGEHNAEFDPISMELRVYDHAS